MPPARLGTSLQLNHRPLPPSELVNGPTSVNPYSRWYYLRNPQPSGGRPAIVRNLAWRRATGTFVHFLDNDDVVPEGHYLAVKRAFSRAPNVGVVFGPVAPFGFDESQLAHERDFFSRAARRATACQRFGTQMAFAARLLFNETLLVCSAGVIRRECVVAVNGFDSEIPLMEDVDFYTRTIRGLVPISCHGYHCITASVPHSCIAPMYSLWSCKVTRECTPITGPNGVISIFLGSRPSSAP
jgi:hypothetical protein